MELKLSRDQISSCEVAIDALSQITSYHAINSLSGRVRDASNKAGYKGLSEQIKRIVDELRVSDFTGQEIVDLKTIVDEEKNVADNSSMDRLSVQCNDSYLGNLLHTIGFTPYFPLGANLG